MTKMIHQLPVERDTLLLRLLGRDAVQKQAVEELLQLTEEPLKRFILDKIGKYQIMLKSSRTLSKEDQETMVNIEPIYEAWLSEKQQEVHRASVEAMLIFKFGTIDPELEAIIPKLLLLDPLARTQQIMTLSREALLKSQG